MAKARSLVGLDVHAGIDNAEIIETVHAQRAPMIPVTTSPRRQLQATPPATRRRPASRYAWVTVWIGTS
jgi:hypothetical protein